MELIDNTFEMLKTLHIENYALISQSDINFDGGFVAITGETGAGKSIMLGALALLLGQRSDTKTLYNPERKCVVEALFDIKQLNLKHLFDENDVDYSDDGSLIIRREILPNGKSRAFVNDTPVAVTFLKQLGSAIIDIHSQHASLLLGDSTFQTSVLDCIGNGLPLLDDYQTSYRKYTSLKRQLEQMTAEEEQNRKDYDYNKFLFDELTNANLSDGEQEELEQEASLLANAENIKQSLSQIISICDGEEDSALSRLNASKSILGKISDCHKELTALNERFDSSLIELRDIVSSLDTMNEEITFSPERQQQVEERLDLIYRLEKKHGADSIAKLLEIQNNLDSKLSNLDITDQRIHEVMEAVDKSFNELQKKAEALTKCRKKATKELESQIAKLLVDLAMPNATLKAEVVSTADYGPLGNNRVSLLFNANKGGELREIAKVASGGEMARLMLAIKSLTAKAGLLPTVIFDEIDTGISGDISVKVGNIMQRMSSDMQVIAITHLPQIAARATQHYKVYKSDDGEKTASKIKLLDNDGRRYELAVMLSAEPPSAAALQTATELMQM
ncbi:MAG: DNA repair protein RecN [Bacteroidales bacterium]|nr:DNA repair protein RecN [Bacteroidales bacterium]